MSPDDGGIAADRDGVPKVVKRLGVLSSESCDLAPCAVGVYLENVRRTAIYVSWNLRWIRTWAVVIDVPGPHDGGIAADRDGPGEKVAERPVGGGELGQLVGGALTPFGRRQDRHGNKDRPRQS